MEWRFAGMKAKKQKCSRGGTVQQVLKRGKDFSALEKENGKKELVIIYRGRAISYHFPCCLIGDEPLTIKYITPVNKPKKPVPPKTSGSMENLVVFHLFLKRPGNTLRNRELKKAVGELSVYAYKEETVHCALKRDGRLRDVVFKKYELLQKDTGETVKFSALVDDLNDKLFEISASSLPNSRPGSLDNAPNVDEDMDETPVSDPDSE